MPLVQLPCEAAAHADRSAEPDWTALTASYREFPAGHTPTAEELRGGGLCLACARLEPPPPLPGEE